MISPSAPYVRLRRPALLKLQSAPFLSPFGRHPSLNPSHAVRSQPPPKSILRRLESGGQAKGWQVGSGRPMRAGMVGLEGTVWQGRTQLSDWLTRFASSYRLASGLPPVPSPFLPTYDSARRVWRSPQLSRPQKVRLCKEAFLWRLEFARASFGPSFRAETFSWGGVEKDPVPEVVQLLGGEEKLTQGERRALGMSRRGGEDWGGVEGGEKVPLTGIVKRIPSTSTTRSSPSPSPSTVLVPGTGFLSHRARKSLSRQISPPNPTSSSSSSEESKPQPRLEPINPAFKGTLEERKKGERVGKVWEKMRGMEERVRQYRGNVRESKKKAKPSMPF